MVLKSPYPKSPWHTGLAPPLILGQGAGEEREEEKPGLSHPFPEVLTSQR